MSGVPVAFLRRGVAQAILGIGTDGFDAELLGDVPLQRADGDGGVDGAAAARVLAGRRADAPADRGERVGRARDEECVFVTALGDELHVAARVGRDRAAGLALDLGLPVGELRDTGRDAHSGPTRG